ncbi:MAG: FtsW/RodA/SpoVE family cell cycle protein [Acidobacteriota bacterium]
MGVTYTRASERARPVGRRVSGLPHPALLVTSAISLVALVLAYAGRSRALDVAAAPTTTAPAVVNLSRGPSAQELEPAMAAVFENVADRRLAANQLSAALGRGGELQDIANVGAIARISVPADTIRRTRGLSLLATRLRDAEARATESDTPIRVPLFTALDVSTLKPDLIVRTRAEYRRVVLLCIVGLAAGVPLVGFLWWLTGRKGDPLLLASAHLLITLGGLVMLARPDPLRDTVLLVRFTWSVLAGSVACAALSQVRMRTAAWLQLPYLSLASAVTLSLLLFLFGSGPGTSGAKVNLGPMQPVELIRLLFALFLAGYLGRRWELLRQTRETEWRSRTLPRWIDLPRFDLLAPVLGAVTIALVLFFALRDLGPALLLALLFMTMFAVARAGVGAVVAGVAILGSGFAAGYWLGISSTLTSRVAMWRSPWENGTRGGDQIAQALWALAAGAFQGSGLGLGDTRYLPAGHTDLVLAAVGEELGFVGLVVVALAGVVIAVRGLRIARSAPTDTTCFLALALAISLVVPMLVMGAGILGLIPLTGVVTPFISYGGSAMLANFAALGLLSATASDAGAATDTKPFATSMTWLGGALGACALAIVIVAGRTQLAVADEVLVRPQLGRQADGGVRYQYNPRVLDAADSLPRGTILDRRDVRMAGPPETIRQSATQLATIGVPRDAMCADSTHRCYPLGGVAFHVLGNAETRTNWAASNSSYIERDAGDRLRGFDDHAAIVPVNTDGNGGSALRRDYRDLVPLVRHRWEPDDASVRALRSRTRDVHLTVDAHLQMKVASILAQAAAVDQVTKAAAVVLDANTGEILASVSYPWPAADGSRIDGSDDALLDRARYGLYPPGSTFKLITAAAALGLDQGLGQLAFTCSRLGDDRVGARIPGWSRPIRDDVLDHEPHGTLTMHDAIVRSCNAYFAQLAVRLGVEPLARTAGLAGIIFPTSGPAARLRENLPYSGYGQGDVLASPLRMARVAAALGTDGMIREPSLLLGEAPPPPKRLVPEASARILSGYMRDVVTDGTGRLLKSNAVRIAGKTGTAEVDHARSHAWFIGFAPAGPAAKRIAFAVILENAGYGGNTAAAVAGQVVTSAATLGLVR